MSATKYRVLHTRWDELNENQFRLIHTLNVIKITHSGSHTKVEYDSAGGDPASVEGMLVWDDTGKWYRSIIHIDGVVGHSYSKTLTFDPGEGEGPKKHRVTMTAYSVKTVGQNVKKVVFGYLQQTNVGQSDDSHTGEWR